MAKICYFRCLFRGSNIASRTFESYFPYTVRGSIEKMFYAMEIVMHRKCANHNLGRKLKRAIGFVRQKNFFFLYNVLMIRGLIFNQIVAM